MGMYCDQSTLALGFFAEATVVGIGSGKRCPTSWPLAAVVNGVANSGGAKLS